MRSGSRVCSRNPWRPIGCLPALPHAAPFGHRHVPSASALHTLNTPKPRSANQRAARMRSSAVGRGPVTAWDPRERPAATWTRCRGAQQPARTRARRPWTTRNEAWSRGVRHSARARSRKAASASSGMRMVIVGMPRLNVRSSTPGKRGERDNNPPTMRQECAIRSAASGYPSSGQPRPWSCRKRWRERVATSSRDASSAWVGRRPRSARNASVRRPNRAGRQLARAPRAPAPGHGGVAARPLGCPAAGAERRAPARGARAARPRRARARRGPGTRAVPRTSAGGHRAR